MTSRDTAHENKAVLPRNFGDPVINQGEQGTKIPKIMPPDERVDIGNPETKAETTENIGRKEKLTNLRRNFQWEKTYRPLSEPSPEKCRTKNIKKGNPQEWSVSLIFFRKAKVFGTHQVKNPMGRFQPIHIAGVKNMGGEAASTTNPDKGHVDKWTTNM